MHKVINILSINSGKRSGFGNNDNTIQEHSKRENIVYRPFSEPIHLHPSHHIHSHQHHRESKKLSASQADETATETEAKTGFWRRAVRWCVVFAVAFYFLREVKTRRKRVSKECIHNMMTIMMFTSASESSWTSCCAR